MPARTSPACRPAAEDMGDHFLVNGQKIWTSGAQWADWCFCLVRTDTTKKHEGISFLLIDMSVARHRGAADPADQRQLALLRNLLHRCEGAQGKSRRAARMAAGPSANACCSTSAPAFRGGGGAGRGGDARSLADIAKDYMGADENGRVADGDLRARIAEYMMDARAFQLTAAPRAGRSQIGAGARAPPSPS